jgi:hypothetical protein
MSANNAIPPTPTAVLACSKCGATLPEDAQFCLKCGKAVSVPAKNAPTVEVLPPMPVMPRRKPRVLRWVLPILLVIFVLWVTFSSNPFATGIQELVGVKQDATILDAPFTVGAHSFRFYKIALPEGSVNVSVVGQFACDTDSKDKAAPNGNIEVYILGESAFTIWQNGYATGSLYESGQVAKGDVNAELPAGAGIYYLVFSNKSSPKTPQAMHASFVLRYKSWMPEEIRRAKARFTNWLGL